MLNPTQIRADFNKLRDPNHEHGQIVVVGFNGETARGLKSQTSQTIEVSEWGETVGNVFTVRFLDDDFTTTPSEKDVVTIDGEEFQVGEVRYGGYNQIVRLYLLDPES